MYVCTFYTLFQSAKFQVRKTLPIPIERVAKIISQFDKYIMYISGNALERNEDAILKKYFPVENVWKPCRRFHHCNWHCSEYHECRHSLNTGFLIVYPDVDIKNLHKAPTTIVMNGFNPLFHCKVQTIKVLRRASYLHRVFYSMKLLTVRNERAHIHTYIFNGIFSWNHQRGVCKFWSSCANKMTKERGSSSSSSSRFHPTCSSHSIKSRFNRISWNTGCATVVAAWKWFRYYIKSVFFLPS